MLQTQAGHAVTRPHLIGNPPVQAIGKAFQPGRFDKDPRSNIAFGASVSLPTLRILAELFQEGSPEIQVLFADVRMPGMSGPELAQVARRLRPDLRIVLTSGYVSRDDVPDGIPFVPKPWRTGDLVDVVRRAASSELSGRERAA